MLTKRGKRAILAKPNRCRHDNDWAFYIAPEKRKAASLAGKASEPFLRVCRLVVYAIYSYVVFPRNVCPITAVCHNQGFSGEKLGRSYLPAASQPEQSSSFPRFSSPALVFPAFLPALFLPAWLASPCRPRLFSLTLISIARAVSPDRLRLVSLT